MGPGFRWPHSNARVVRIPISTLSGPVSRDVDPFFSAGTIHRCVMLLSLVFAVLLLKCKPQEVQLQDTLLDRPVTRRGPLDERLSSLRLALTVLLV